MNLYSNKINLNIHFVFFTFLWSFSGNIVVVQDGVDNVLHRIVHVLLSLQFAILLGMDQHPVRPDIRIATARCPVSKFKYSLISIIKTRIGPDVRIFFYIRYPPDINSVSIMFIIA